MRRLTLALLALLVSGLSVSADQLLGTPRIVSGTNAVTLPGGPTLGKWVSGAFTSTPSDLQLLGGGMSIDATGRLTMSGSKSTSAITDTSTVPNGILLNGTYSGSQIAGVGWNVSSGGVLTNGGIKLVSSAPDPTVFAGISQYNGLYYNDGNTASKPTLAGAFITLDSVVGGNPQTDYVAGVVSHIAVKASGNSGFAGNFVCDMGSNLVNRSTATCHGMEIDLNNGDSNRYGRLYGGSARSVGILLNGGGVYTNNAAIMVGSGTGTFSLWDYGVIFDQQQPNFSSIRTATIADYTYAPSSYQDRGLHSIGLDLGGTYSARSISAPSFYVDSAGNTSGKSFAAGGASTASGASFADPTSNGTSYIDTGTHTNGVTLAGMYSNASLILPGGAQFDGTGRFQHRTANQAAAGTTQGTATLLQNDVNVVTTGTGGVQISNKVGQRQIIINRSGASITVYPASGAAIDANAANAGVTVSTGTTGEFTCATATQCYRTI